MRIFIYSSLYFKYMQWVYQLHTGGCFSFVKKPLVTLLSHPPLLGGSHFFQSVLNPQDRYAL